VVEGVAAASEADGRRDFTDQLGFERNAAVSALVSRTRLVEYVLVKGVLVFDANAAKRRLARERRHTATGIIYGIYDSYNNISHAFAIGNMFIRTFRCWSWHLDGILMRK
jgi:hypothetical protein